MRSTIALAHDLGIKVVAEGIEDAGCPTFLRDAGCGHAQGRLVARPVPIQDLVALLTTGRVAARATS